MVGDTILIKDISINGNNNVTGGLNTATSDKLSETLTGNTINALGIDASSRTIWINGQPYGNAYVNIKEDNTTVEAPIGAEIFNDFEHNIASGEYSHAEGKGTITNNEAEHAEGKYNKSNINTIHSVGIGTSDTDRKNAIEIVQNGDVYINGIGGYNGTNTTNSKHLATILSTVDTSDNNAFIVENVLDVEGNTTLKGTLQVNGATNLNGNVTLGDAQTDVITVNGNTAIKGTLGVENNTTIDKNLTVNGATNLNGNVTLGDTQTDVITVNGNTTIKGTLGVENNTTISGTLQVNGETSLENKVAAGEGTFVQNDSEIAVGRFNKSNKNSDNYGNEGNTAFSIGIGESDNTRKNAVEVMQNGDVYINGVGEYNGTNPSDSSDLATYLPNMVNITYTDLKTLIDNDQLVPGQQYRITDYTCTTTTVGTRAAGNQFDIIVTADSKSVLNEEARAIQHDFPDDTSEDIKNHFANSDLNAWKIWYCLDNDTKRFAWADNSNNGRGVIYRMIDEWNNDVPYDFKNIIYVVPLSFIYNKNAYIYKFSRDTSIDMNINGTWYYGYITESTIPGWSENKCWVKEQNPNINSFLYKKNGIDTITDGNIIKVNLNTYETYTFGKDDSSLTGNCYNNIILPYYKSNILTLNNNTFDSGCYSNSFGNNCYNNSFGSNFRHNSFGNSCYCNSFGPGCDNNIFGNYCYNSVFEMTFHGNSFGNSCCNNYFDLGCNYNSFANNCICNSVGKNCTYNTFSNGCGDISIGNYCSYNFFGNGCSYIKFASDISEPSTKYNYYQNNHFGDRCKFILFTGSENSNSSSQVQNYNFAQGLQGKSGSKYLLVTGKRGRQYDTMVSMSRDYGNTVYGYCLADLANTVTHEVFNFS